MTEQINDRLQSLQHKVSNINQVSSMNTESGSIANALGTINPIIATARTEMMIIFNKCGKCLF